jgi:hypothetical protein
VTGNPAGSVEPEVPPRPPVPLKGEHAIAMGRVVLGVSLEHEEGCYFVRSAGSYRRFPLGEMGWVAAWQDFSAVDPVAASAVRMQLANKDTHPTRQATAPRVVPHKSSTTEGTSHGTQLTDRTLVPSPKLWGDKEFTQRFSVCAVRDLENGHLQLWDRGAGFVAESVMDPHGLMYPVIALGSPVVAGEPGDGDSYHVEANGLKLEQHLGKVPSTLLSIRSEYVDVLVTESRVAICCEKWNKQQRAVGANAGALVAGAINLARSGLEARLRRGTRLVGHVRYNWMRRLTYRAPSLALPNTLSMVCLDGYDKRRAMVLTLYLPRSVGQQLANDLLVRTARYWLGRAEELTADKRARFERIAMGEEILPAPARGKRSTIAIDHYERAMLETARMRRA